MGALNSSNSVGFFGLQIWDEGQRGKQGREGSSHRWTFCCRWTDYPTILFRLMGGAALVDGVVVIGFPFIHPQFPWLAVTDTDYEGVAGATGLTVGVGGMVAYDYCRVTAEFTSGNPSDLGEEEICYSGSILTVPDNTFAWGDATPLLAAESPGLIIGSANFVRGINNLAQIPVATILGLLGRVNSSSFLGAAPGTLLYAGANSSRRWTTQGVKNWDLNHNLNWRSVGWNQYLRASTGAFEAITLAGNPSRGPYLTGDFSTLGFSV